MMNMKVQTKRTVYLIWIIAVDDCIDVGAHILHRKDNSFFMQMIEYTID